MIKLTDLISLAGLDLQNYKIHCATGKPNPPLEAFFDGKFKEWQEYQNQRNFQCEQVLAIIHLRNDKWLFAGVFRVLGVEQKEDKHETWFYYNTEEIPGLEHLVGRAIIQFQKDFRASYLIGNKHIDKLLVSEIRDQKMSVGDFPGYNSVIISHRLLCTVVREELPSWKSALSIVSGVYIITDRQTGKHYVGSAYGGEGIWQRWVSYSSKGHGGNKELKALIENSPSEYVFNFQYSVLEVCDLNANNEYVISRENHWKEVIRSREFGYNDN